MLPGTDLKACDKDLDWICRLYIEEVWAYLYPDYRPRVSPNERFMRAVEAPFVPEGPDVDRFRQQFAQMVKAYARTGVRFSWNCDPFHKSMFEAYYANYETSDTIKATCRLINMKDMIEYMNEWINNAAYYIWEQEGKPEGRDAEHWERALQMFIEAHS